MIAALLIVLALLGAPLFALIAASAMWGFRQEGIDLQAVAIEFYGIGEIPLLIAIPLFTFAGYLLSESGAPRRLVRVTSALMGWMPAGDRVAGGLRVFYRLELPASRSCWCPRSGKRVTRNGSTWGW